MIEKIIQQVPDWEGKEITHTPLVGGITNTNYKVTVGNESFVVRVVGEKSSLLGIERVGEHAINQLAAEIGIAPEIIHVTSEGHSIARFIEGKSFSVEEIRDFENIARIAKAIRDFHSLPEVPWQFCSFRIVENYAKTVKEYGSISDEIAWTLEEAKKIEDRLNKKNRPICLCHNDLLNGNFIDDGKIRIIDWEYAGMGDPFFDMANFSTNHEFDETHDKTLLGHYLDRDVTESDMAHHYVMKIMSDFREAMWAQVQSHISDLDEDFASYSKKHLERLRSRLEHKDYATLLDKLV